MLALQRFTLSDLEAACGDDAAALRQMAACAAAAVLVFPASSSIRAQAVERLAELRGS